MRRASVLPLLALLAACPRPHAAARDGQWIWSAADRAVHAEAQAARPELAAGVWVGSVRYDPRTRTVALRRALAPTGSRVAVVRFESDFTAAFEQSDAQLAAAVIPQLQVLLARTPLDELQLDYDAPARLLPRWATLARAVAAAPGMPEQVWVTSLVAHLRDRRYGGLFRAPVDGHLLQVFDTGERWSPAAEAEVVRLVRRADLPFRLGIGTFERRFADGRTTDHLAWRSAIPRLRTLPGWRGLWVFPAGRSWTRLVPEGA